MIKNDLKIKELIYENVVTKLSTDRGISISDAKKIISEMSFIDYHRMLDEATITPPSGQTIAPTSSQSPQPQNGTSSGPNQIKSIWPGQGAPMEVGMTVGLKGENGTPTPGEISKVDMGSNGVLIKDPTTGKTQWYNNKDIQPFSAATNTPPGQSAQGQQNQPQITAEDDELGRLLELAGLSEDASGGATCAGSIAVAPAVVGGIKRRQATEELKKEYTRKEPAKSIIGDTKPGQNMGQLSATLAANGAKSAGRKNNGFKK